MIPQTRREALARHPYPSALVASALAWLIGLATFPAVADPPTAQDLLALTSSCRQVSSGKFPTDEGRAATVRICGLTGAVFWKADMDIDCDGKPSPQCNKNTDPWFQPMTSAVSSKREYLDAAKLPFTVVPIRSSKFDYRKAGLHLGSVIAVIYNGKLVYTVFGDENGEGIIGEASYATAAALGIDPDPAEGGTDSGVTYIAFTGAGGVASPIESHDAAVRLGQQLGAQLIANNR